MKTTEANKPDPALKDALELIRVGPRRDSDPAAWIAAASKMCKHCLGSEDVTEAAARITANTLKTFLK